jgi:hypothetical protein
LAQSLKEQGGSLLYGSGSDQNTAVIFYGAASVFVSFCFNILWRYSTYHYRLLDEHADPTIVAAIHAQYRFAPL